MVLVIYTHFGIYFNNLHFLKNATCHGSTITPKARTSRNRSFSQKKHIGRDDQLASQHVLFRDRRSAPEEIELQNNGSEGPRYY